MITEVQKAERVNYIGASDAAAVLGLSRWSTPLEVWGLKTGNLQPKDLSDKLSVELGNELEDVVARLFTKRTGKKVYRVNETVYHKEYPFIAANLDRRVVGEDAVLEIKTSGAWAAKSWEGEEIPQEVVIQVMHQLAVTGKRFGYAACLIGGNMDFHIKTVERDEEAIKQIISREVDFWKQFVEPKIMPTMITKNDKDILGELYPMGENEEPIKLGEDADVLLDLIEGYEVDSKALDGQIDKAKNEILAMLKERQVGFTDRWKVTYKDVVSRRIQTDKMKKEAPELYQQWSAESRARQLRSSKLKGK